MVSLMSPTRADPSGRFLHRNAIIVSTFAEFAHLFRGEKTDYNVLDLCFYLLEKVKFRKNNKHL